jgi:hypothetical protein
LALICTAVFGYGLCGPRIGWLSDDYAEVFGYSYAVPDWRTAFKLGGAGHWSPYRLLKYPIQGYVAFWLGPRYTHVAQFLCHVVCILLFYSLLKRIAWPTPASLAAAMLFSVSPWLSQAVYWWPAASSIWTTIFVLAAAHCYILWREGHRLRWAIAYAAFVVLGLVTYELWLGGFLFFAGLDWYHRRTRKSLPDAPANERRDSPWRYAAMAAPFMVYLLLYWLAPSSEASDRLAITLPRVPFAIAMVQLRALEWPVDVQWHWTLLNAGLAFHSALGLLALTAEVVVLLLFGTLWAAKSPQGNLALPVPLWVSLVLACTLFLGSRISLILQTYISRYDQRENYGGSMGIAIAVVALASRLIQTRQPGARVRAITAVSLPSIVLVLGWASSGIGIHYVEASRAEAQTIGAVDRWMSVVSPSMHRRTIVVVAAKNVVPQGTIELGYFNEHNGYWLDFLVKQRCPDCTTLVVDHLDCVANRPEITLRDSDGAKRTVSKIVLDDKIALFRWTGEDLIPEPTACH